MKVLHLIQKQQLRGAEIFASQLASHINHSGNEAVIVSLFKGDADLPFDGNTISLNGNLKGRMHDFKAWKKLSEIIKEERPHIIQANAGDTLRYAVFSKLIYRWKQPIIFRNASTISLYIKNRFQKRWNSFLFGFTDKIVSVSNNSALDFAKLFPNCKDRIITIPIGIEHVETPKGMNGVAGRTSFDGQDGPLVIHVGGFSFEKNHRGLINIFESVLVKSPSARLYLVGDGPLKPEIEQIVNSKGLSSSIKFLGFQKNVMKYIRSADVLILPSLIEGLPGVILEAFYCRIPVVAYDVGGIKEIVINNKTGKLIEKGNEIDFSNAILEVLQSPSINKEMINNAYALVTSKYLNSEIAREFLDVYHSVAPNSH